MSLSIDKQYQSKTFQLASPTPQAGSNEESLVQ